MTCAQASATFDLSEVVLAKDLFKDPAVELGDLKVTVAQASATFNLSDRLGLILVNRAVGELLDVQVVLKRSCRAASLTACVIW